MLDQPAAASGRRARCALVWAERLLIGSGAAMLVWVALLVADARRLSATGTRRHGGDAAEAVAPSTSVSSGVASTPCPPCVGRRSASCRSRVWACRPWCCMGRMRAHCAAARATSKTPPLPGEPGNIAIAGHRDSFFRPIRRCPCRRRHLPGHTPGTIRVPRLVAWRRSTQRRQRARRDRRRHPHADHVLSLLARRAGP